MSEPQGNNRIMWINQSSHLISNILSPAVRLWLRSQVEGVEQLKFKITGHDRQILRGYIPLITLESYQAIYQGLHLGEIRAQANNIRINLGQVVRGKPIKLLEPIWLTGEVQLSQENLQASLGSALLQSGLKDLLKLLLPSQTLPEIQWQEIRLYTDKFSLKGQLLPQNQPIDLQAGLSLKNPQTLCLNPVQVTGFNSPLYFPEILLDLGSEVELQTLNLGDGYLKSQGQFVIKP